MVESMTINNMLKYILIGNITNIVFRFRLYSSHWLCLDQLLRIMASFWFEAYCNFASDHTVRQCQLEAVSN